MRHRAELSVQERSDHIAEWMRLTVDRISGKLPQNHLIEVELALVA